MRISIDARYIRRGRPSGIGTYVKALVDRLPDLAPADTFHLWVSPTAERPISPRSNTCETLVQAAPNTAATLFWPTRLADLRNVDALHAPFNVLGRNIPCPTVTTIHDL